MGRHPGGILEVRPAELIREKETIEVEENRLYLPEEILVAEERVLLDKEIKNYST